MEPGNGPARGRMVILTSDQGMALACRVLERHGFAPDEARTIANHLVEAELRGHTTTGLVRLKALVQMAQKGRTPIRIVSEGPGFAHIDGGGNPGSLSAEYAVRLGIDKARANSFAIVALFNSAQGGISGHYMRIAGEAGFAACLFSSSYGRVAPFGAIDPVIGTNPIAFGFPGNPPVIVDAATSLVNNGDVELARARAELLPEGAAVDGQGRPTREPAAAAKGALLPIAGHKGSAIGLAMQMFGILAGGDAVPENRGNFGFLFLIVDPALFAVGESFEARASNLRDAIKTARRAAGSDEIRLPGEGGDARRERHLRDGFEISRKLMRELEALG